jgi:hypothetical protein
MKFLKSALFAAALVGGAMTVGAAGAAPALDSGVSAPGVTQEVRLVCNEWGRCWRTGPRWNRGYGYGYRRHRHWDGGPRRWGPPRQRFYGGERW